MLMQPRPRGAGPRDGAAHLLLVFLLLAAPPAPDWADPHTLGRSPRYLDSTYLTGFGLSAESLAAAEELARRNLARRVEVTVEGRTDFRVGEIQQGGLTVDEQRYYQHSSSHHRVVLQGIDYERYQHHGQFYALAVLRIDRAASGYRGAVRRQLQESVELLATPGAWQDSLRNSVRAAALAGEAWPAARIVAGLQPDCGLLDSVYTARRAGLARLDSLLAGVELRGANPTAPGVWGEALDRPLDLAVWRGGRPLSGVPVAFRFTRGGGELGAGGSGDTGAVVATTAA
ncbi:MAG: hypothetical protein AB1505_32040, partial [Candidatus Latescibacterota bacterium]